MVYLIHPLEVITYMFSRFVTLPMSLTTALVLSACGTTFSEPDSPLDGPESVPSAPVATGSSDAVEAPIISADNYILGQGDKLSIQVFDEPDLTMEAAVGASGVINYSYLGDLRVSGKSPLQLEQQITSQLQDGYLVNPSVNVTVTEYRPFFIGGEVRSPGSYPYQPGLTLNQAIAIAGGLTDRASQRQMFITKAKSSDGQQRSALNAPVGPGDTVTIKEGFF